MAKIITLGEWRAVIAFSSILKDRYINIIIGIIICLFILGLIIKIIVNNFNEERKEVKQKTLELENTNLILRTKDIEIIQKQNQNIQVSEELKNSEKKFESFFRIAQDIIYVMDKDGIILEVNHSVIDILGYSENEMIHKYLGKFLIPCSRKYFTDNIPVLLRNGSKRSELKFMSKKSEIITVDCCASVIYDSRGNVECIVAFQRDITELKKKEEKITYLAYHDMLTNLPNRRFGKELLHLAVQKHLSKNSKFGVMFLDLDRFKYINDTLGHDMGDFLLLKVAERLKICVRESDTVVRLGGDEFMIILDGPCSFDFFEELSKMAKKIIDSFSKQFNVNTMEIYTSCSIGIASFPEDGEDVESLLKNTDIAMYQAKEAGRNNFKFFSRKIDYQIKKEMQIREEIIQAIEKKEFVLYYQPKVNIKSGKIVGSEALIRWKHPQKGLIYPNDFIPIAEKCGLIKKIDKLVLKMACNQIKKWANKGVCQECVSVNISANQFNDIEFIGTLDAILSETEIDPKLLNLEITETAAMQDTSYAQKIFGEIKKRGINISLDDFGTGYSSLNYLILFPIDVLKIDKSFVDEICFNKVNKTIVLATITMAKALDIKVIVEGVETKEQLAILRDFQCEEYQGYLFSKAVPVEEIESMIIKN
ncbi:EAL domain-containing protein [Clostridium sp.]|uniref:sensor domain-containing protein n=1 Tax=Clostridium sp. TaxID=1506 RepID=UPI001A56457C|nr:EAL domain-containing protein [Clostridium sp.]MBK5243302.1 EAL domain-containing protein [Clostridium sp.]